MRLFHSHEEIRRRELKTVGWFFTVMGVVTVVFAFALAGHYLLGWW